MQPGRVLRLKSGIDTLTITVLPDTQEVDGITTGILEERETKNGTLAEISRNFFATDRKTGDVYYFGEDVDNYKDGKMIGPFVPERSKILPRRISGTCAKHQRKLQTAIKRARQIALIPYVTD